MILCCTLLLTTFTFGQFYKPGNAPVIWPPNGFGAEGDAFNNVWLYPTIIPNNVGDWFSTTPPDALYPGLGGTIFDAAGDTISPGSSSIAILAHFVDGYKNDPGGDLTVFAESDKIEDHPESYDVKAGSVPPKDDIQHADGVFTYGDPSLGPFVAWDQPGHETGYSAYGVATDLWCLFACDRWKINGASYADFEFNQNVIEYDAVTGLFTSFAPDFDSDGDPTGGRTPGDILITVEFTNGGAVGDVWVDKWLKLGVGQAYHWVTQDITTGVYIEGLFASFNNVDNHVPWPIYDQEPDADGHYVYAPNQYIEGSINLTNVMEGVGDECGTLATIWVRTKSSHSPTAQLKDLAGIFNVGISPDPPVPTCPDPVVLGPCPDLTAMETAYDTWRTGFSYTSGTEPVTEIFDPVLPEDLPAGAECGYEISVEYKVVDFCDKADSCTSSFSVQGPELLEVTCPEPYIIDTFIPQEDVDDAFADWLDGFGFTGGCNPDAPILDYAPPNHCGGFVEITYTVTDDCDQSAECFSYFIIDFVIEVTPLCPEDPDLPPCTPLADIQAAYAAWVAGFIPQGSCPPFVTNILEVPPLPANVECEGANLSFTFITTDACDVTDQCTATFTVQPAPPIDAYCPGDLQLGSCLTQEQVDAEFVDWIDGFGFTGGCNAYGTELGGYLPPPFCGGEVNIIYEAYDDCDQYDWCVATFSVAAPDPILIDCPAPVLLPACTPSTDVVAAYNAWELGFTKSGDCNLTDNMAAFPSLVIQSDGSVSLSFTYIVTGECDALEHTCSSTFNVPPCMNCETAYAKRTEDEFTECFLDWGFSQWGWTNLIEPENEYVMPIYAGAAQCLYSDENLVGTATVSYIGGDITVEYNIDAGYSMDQAHVYVGCNMFPKFKGKFTVAPGKYTFVSGELDFLSGLTVSFTNIQDPVWIIIHAVTCDVLGSGTATFGPINMGIDCIKEASADLTKPTDENAIDVNIHPNPFITSTDIDFTVPESGKVTVEIYNTLGEKIKTLFNNPAEAGHKYNVSFSSADANGQGMYLCVIRTEKSYIVKPLILNK
jgi:hypothetical protein